MAATTHSIDIIINAVNGTGAGLQSVSNNLNTAVGKIGSFTPQLSELADKVLETEAAVTALGLAFLTVAVKEADDFAGKMAEINSLTNGNEESFNELKKSVQNFALNSTSNIDTISKAMYVTTSNVGSTAKAMDILGVAQKGAVVGATDLETTAALLTRTMNAYGLVTEDSAKNTENAEKVMAVMFATVQNGDLNMDALSSNMGKVASSAKAAGIDIETVGAAIAALTGAGVSADESFTLLNGLIQELLNPSEALQKAMGGLSVQVDGLPRVLEELKKSTGGSADKLFDLFSSSEAAKSAIILANDNAGKFAGTLNAMGGATANFNQQYENMAGGIGDSTQKLQNSFSVLLQKIGAPLQTEFAAILDGLASITNGFSISIDDGTFDPVFAAFDNFQKDIVDYLQQVAKVLPEALGKVDFTQWLDSLGQVGLDISGLFSDIDLTSPEGLAHAIQIVVDGLENLNNVVGGIISVWSPVIKTFFKAGEAFIDLDKNSERTVGQILGMSQVFESLKSYLDGGISAIEGVGKALQYIAAIDLATGLARIAPSLGPLVAIAPELIALGLTFGVLALEAKAYYDIHAEKTALNQSIAESTKAYQAGLAELKDTYQEISQRTGIAINSTSEFHQLVENGTLVLDKANDRWTTSADLLNSISKATGITVKSQDELNRALASGLIVFDQATGTYTSHDQQIAELAKKTEHAAFVNGGWASSVDKVAQSMNLVDSKGERLIGTFGSLESAERGAASTLEEGYKSIIRYEDGVYKVSQVVDDSAKKHEELKKAVEDTSKSNVRGSTEWKNVQDAIQAATDSAAEFRLKAAELAEKRYEANITAVVDLKVAEVEAQTKQIEAAFESLNKGIESTGDTLAGLADTLAQNVNPNNNDFLKRLASEENDRRNQEFDLQKELINNQVENLKLKNERLKKGDALIQISSDGLAPELDSLFDVILKRVQIKASEEGTALLLGLGAD
jgi:TP901 family phage tail tape measure protein